MLERIAIRPPMAFDAAGLVLGSDTRLAWLEKNGRLVCDPERFEGLLTVALGRRPSVRNLSAIERGLVFWQTGDAALANLRLVFSGLPRLDAPQDLHRLKAAEILFDAGLTTDHVLGVIGLDGLGKDVANEPRVPPGNGRQSGEWTSSLWSRFSAWLDEDVPVYDQDTGTQVGTQSRARAIVTSPLAVGAAGTAVLLGGEAALPEAAPAVAEAPTSIRPVVDEVPKLIEPAAEESETLSDFARRYLSTSGGRLGNTTTRRQLYEIARDYSRTGEYSSLEGDGYGSEEFIRGVGNEGDTYVDFTATRPDGTAVRIQTVDTFADGMTPNTREATAAARIRAQRPGDELILIPKRRP